MVMGSCKITADTATVNHWDMIDIQALPNGPSNRTVTVQVTKHMAEAISQK